MKSRKRFRLLLSYCHNEAIGRDQETDDAFYIFYLSQTRSRKSFIINCCLGRVSLQPRPRLMLYSDISTSPQPRASRQSWSPSWCRGPHLWSLCLWPEVVSVPHSHLPALWGLRLGWTTASPQNPASKWISHGVTILHVYTEYLSAMFVMRV